MMHCRRKSSADSSRGEKAMTRFCGSSIDTIPSIHRRQRVRQPEQVCVTAHHAQTVAFRLIAHAAIDDDPVDDSVKLTPADLWMHHRHRDRNGRELVGRTRLGFHHDQRRLCRRDPAHELPDATGVGPEQDHDVGCAIDVGRELVHILRIDDSSTS